MTITDYQVFSDAIGAMFAGWGKVPEKSQIDFYWSALENYPLADVQDGILAAARTSGSYVPRIGQICDAINEIRHGGSNYGVTAGATGCDDCHNGWRFLEHTKAVTPCHCPAGRKKQRRTYGD